MSACTCPRGKSDVYVAHHRTVCLGEPETAQTVAAEYLVELSEKFGGDLPDVINEYGYCKHGYGPDSHTPAVECIHYQVTQWLKAIAGEGEEK